MTDTIEITEMDEIRERATLMGIQFHPSIGLDKLKEKVNERLATTESVVSSKLAKARRYDQLTKEATKLVRVRITNMNPLKKNWPGEVISVGNRVVGQIKKFIPFKDADEGYHVPQIILTAMQDRMFQQFYTVKHSNGQDIRRGKQAKEFAIEILEPLTLPELSALAIKQAQSHNID